MTTTRASREAAIAAHEAEIAALRASIPEEWDAAHETFLDYAEAERTARRRYRLAVDAAYAPVPRALEVLEATEPLETLHAALTALQDEFIGMDRAALPDRVDALQAQARQVPGGDAVAETLGRVERAVSEQPVNMREGYQSLAQAIAATESELDWRRRAAETLRPGLVAYERAIRDTIGLRSQRRLPEEQALYVASCSARHRDISLNF